MSRIRIIIEGGYNIVSSRYLDEMGDESKKTIVQAIILRKHIENIYPTGLNKLCKKTGEFRAPKKGELFLSGANPFGYISYSDMDTEYYIAELIS